MSPRPPATRGSWLAAARARAAALGLGRSCGTASASASKRPRLQVRRHDLDVERLSRPPHRHADRLADFRVVHRRQHGRDVAHGLAADGDDDVVHSQTCRVRRAARHDAVDERPARPHRFVLTLDALERGGRQRRQLQTQISVRRLLTLLEVGGDAQRPPRRHGKPNTVGVRRRRRVDAHDPTLPIQVTALHYSRIDRGVGLDEADPIRPAR